MIERQGALAPAALAAVCLALCLTLAACNGGTQDAENPPSRPGATPAGSSAETVAQQPAADPPRQPLPEAPASVDVEDPDDTEEVPVDSQPAGPDPAAVSALADALLVSCADRGKRLVDADLWAELQAEPHLLVERTPPAGAVLPWDRMLVVANGPVEVYIALGADLRSPYLGGDPAIRKRLATLLGR